MSQHLSQHVRTYAYAVVALGAVVLTALTVDLVHTHHGLKASHAFLVVFFCVLMVLASASPVRLPRGGLVTVAFAVDFAALLIAGPALTAWAAALSWIVLLRKHPFYAVANAAQTVVVLAAAGGAYEWAGGRYVFESSPAAAVPFRVGPLVTAGVAYIFVNSLLASAFVALKQRRPLFGIWQVNFGWLTPQFVALAPFGVLMALVYRVEELRLLIPGDIVVPAGVALFLVPLLWARFSFQGYTQMRQVHLDTIDALARALEGHDEYHGHHADEVGNLTEQVAREIGFPESRMDALRLAARMHDIGKCFIGMEPILKKGRDLSEEDWANIRKHPEIGARIIRQMAVIPGVAEIVRSSHERPDGKGYPDGLTAEQIDVAAMIVAAVDAYHAMTSDRSYRKAMPAAEAIAEMRSNAGTQFDAQVVEAMAALWMRNELGDETGGRPNRQNASHT